MDRHSLATLIVGLTSVAHCTAKDNTRYAISGVLAEPTAEGLRLVATDGHRISLTILPGLKVEGLAKPVVFASEAVKALMAKGKNAPVDLVVNRAGMVVKTAIGTLQFKHMDGKFPPYRDVIPSQVAPHIPLPAFNHATLASTTSWAEPHTFKAFATGGRKSNPVLVISTENPLWLAVLMPIDVADAGIWTEKDGASFAQVAGKPMKVIAAGPVETGSPVVAGTVGLPARQAA